MRPTRSPRRGIRLPSVGVSARVNPRTLLLIAVVTGMAIAVAGWSLTLGSLPLSIDDVGRVLVGTSREGHHVFVVDQVRLPRTITALLTGAALATAGALFQDLIRNPLAAPDIIGVTAGAGLLVVFAIVVAMPIALVPVGALAGALGAGAALLALTWRHGIAGQQLILVGIGLQAIFSALTTLLRVRHPVDRVALAVWWESGTVHGASWTQVSILLAGLGLLMPAAFLLTRPLAALQLGDDTARTLGVMPRFSRFAVLATGCGLVAVAVAAAGPIGFVALIAPHVARMLAGPLTSGVLALSAAVGALMLVAADLAAQHAFPQQLPVGILTAAIGAPYFLFLLATTHRRTER